MKYMQQMIKTQVPLPREITMIMKVRKEELVPIIRKMIAIELFREGLVSIGKAGEIAGLSRHEMLDLLSAKKIPLHYSAEDLREDLETLEKVTK